jgi:hypothetical protein
MQNRWAITLQFAPTLAGFAGGILVTQGQTTWVKHNDWLAPSLFAIAVLWPVAVWQWEGIKRVPVEWKIAAVFVLFIAVGEIHRSGWALGVPIAEDKNEISKAPATAPQRDLAPAVPLSPGQDKLPSRKNSNPLQVLGLNTSATIMLASYAETVIYVLDLLVTIKSPVETHLFKLGFELPPKGFRTFDLGEKGRPALHSTNKVADTLEADLALAKEHYGPNCVTLVAYTESDPSFVQMQQFYVKNLNVQLGAYKEQAVLHYRFADDTKTSAQNVPVYVIPMWIDGCIRK